jgi:micrococcal nuclease
MLLLVALPACSGGGGGSSCGPAHAHVASVIDGDTILLDDGEKVRYLLVDTPESVNGATDCYGHEAAQLNADLVAGKDIDLAYDDAQCKDIYGRLLAYVTVDGREVNALEVERGYACVLYIPPAGTDRKAEFEALETTAKAKMAGMWSACVGMVTCE